MAPLLRLKDNSCHIDESERVLKDAHKYSELVILYEKKGLHQKGYILAVFLPHSILQIGERHYVFGLSVHACGHMYICVSSMCNAMQTEAFFNWLAVTF